MAGVKSLNDPARENRRDEVFRVSASFAHLFLSSFEPLRMLKITTKSNVYCCKILKAEERLQRVIVQVGIVKVVWIAC